jgi:tellurite resistance protein
MNREEADACMRILVAVARADGNVAADEERALAALVGASQRDAPGEIDVSAEARHLRTPEARRATFEAAVALASVDGRCSPEEHALLGRLEEALEIDSGPDLRVAEAAWLERVKQPLAELAAAEVTFLRTLSSRRSEMSDQEYLRLASELQRVRASTLAAALAPAKV